MTRSRVLALGAVAVGVLLVGGGTTAAVFPGAEPDANALPPTALLLETGEWNTDLPGFGQAPVRTGTHRGLSGERITTRTWDVTNSRGRLVVRQYVQRQDSGRRASEVFAAEDPGPVFREKLGSADDLTVTAAPHADEAVGYCVPRGETCSIIRFRLRYGEYLVDFSLADGDFSPTSGDAMLRTLDGVVASRLV